MAKIAEARLAHRNMRRQLPAAFLANQHDTVDDISKVSPIARRPFAQDKIIELEAALEITLFEAGSISRFHIGAIMTGENLWPRTPKRILCGPFERGTDNRIQLIATTSLFQREKSARCTGNRSINAPNMLT